ncbi:S8 family serine peptidase [Paenibacillus polymyxa]|uniref:S8 family serine peptidase n=1 Tax=Paenibacillus polymyxa TaxID=1406 RepID=A0A8I1LVI3_PAEPO|nr:MULTISPECIES: S8 family serine peptidase [Paenibacillus]KAF6571741.1 S8 family serine peptidase [Paenibacillus sp. EKM206P]KAF6586455.1 S8 family serine peptidase [Paenibacillus sp. EKM205P]MBM0635093.1 S8 family serine peptidase [Paenibacillus polymyxa]
MKKPIILQKIPVVSLALALTVSLSLPSVSSAASADLQINSFLEAQQALTIEAAPAFISPELSTDSSRQVRVIVQLDGEPLAVDKYAARSGVQAFTAQSEQKAESAIATEQTTFVDQAAEHGISLQVNYQYNTVLNGLEVTLPANKIPELAKLPGVKSIHENKTYYSIPVQDPPTLTASEATYDNAPLDQIGVPEAWAKGLNGAGIKVGVIDTGIDYEHPDLKEAYKGGYDSFEQDNDPYEEPFLEKENDPFGTGFSGTTHGTHVSGTIAGKAANKSSDIVQKGIAYKSDLYVYKVLGRNTKTGRSSGSSAQVIDGIERAVKDGMNVINLSLGSDSEKDPNSPDSIAINNAVLSGVVAVIANGNAAQQGPYFYSMGSPATSQLAISVGAATSPSHSYSNKASVNLVTYGNDEKPLTVTSDTYYNFNMMAWQTFHEDFSSIMGTEPLELVYANLGYPDDFTSKDVKDKVVIVSRGVLGFVDKIANAQQNGAKAIIIFNGQAKSGDSTRANLSEAIPGYDGYINSNQGDNVDYIPTFDMTGKEGRALARQIIESQNHKQKFFIAFGEEYHRTDNPGNTMAGFSSRGPNGDELLSIKPDVSAPGVSIMSTYPAFAKFYPDASYEQAYKRSNGTSMASPHVAGLAVLLKQQHPNWTPFDIRAALANTSVTLFDEDKIQYDVYSQGAGLVNIANAIQTPALLETVEKITILDKNFNRQEVVNYNPSASFGVLRPGSDAKQIQLQLKNLSANTVQYEASTVLHDNVTSDPTKPIATPDVSNIAVQLQGVGANGAISAEPGKSQPFFLSVQPNSGAATGVYEGEVILKSAGLPTLHLPFVVHVGKENPTTGFGLQDLSVTNPIIYPSRTGAQRSTDLAFRLTTDKTNQIALYVYGVDDKLIGLIDGITTSKEQGANARLKQGVYSFKGIDGSYVELDDNGKPVLDANGQPVIQHLKDGVYKLEVSSPELNEKGEVERNTDGPKLFTATKAIRVDNSAASSGSGGGGGGGGGGRSNTTPSAATNTSTPVPTSAPSLQSVVKQGQAVKTVTTAVALNNNVQSLTVTDADLQAAVTAAGSSPTAIVLSATSQAGQTTKASLTSTQLVTLGKAAAGSSLIVSNTGSSLALPVSALKNVPAGAGIEVIISSQAEASGTFTGKLKGSNVIGTPVGFEANIVTGGKSQSLKVAPGQFFSRSFTVPGQIDSNTAGVLYTANGNVYPVPSVFTKQADGSTVVKVSRPGFSTYAAATRPVSFEDISSSYAQSEIQSLANKLLINGTTDTTFSPKKNVTRAEFAALVTRALGLTPGTAGPFSDIPAGSWYSGDVAAAYEAGLITGRSSDKFDPNANISRQEIAVVLGKAVDLLQIKAAADGPARTPYHDASSFAGYAKDSIEKVSAAGIINGEAIKGSSYFQPNAPTTREASAKVLHVLLQKASLIN